MSNLKKGLFAVLGLVMVMFVLSGCKKEEPKPETPPAAVKQDTVKPAEAKPAAPEVKIEGEYEGKFWNKKMTLVITKQTGKDFEGETTVAWAKPLKMKVKGSFDAEKKTMTFEDLDKSKEAGSYTGTLSADMKTFTGKFALNTDAKKTFDVTLTKK